jgi:hypothetical protein
MRKLLMLLVALAALCALLSLGSAQAQVGGLSFPGPGTPHSSGGGSPPSLDGTPQSGINFFGPSQATGTLTTTAGSGQILVSVYASGTVTINAPTATGLTFTAHSTTINGSGVRISTFTASYTTNFSGTITATCSGTGSVLQVAALAIGNAPTSSPFDPNASVPNVATSGDPAVTTSNANDFLVAVEVTTGAGPTAGTGFTEAIPFTFNNFMVQYQIVSATGSYTATLGSRGAGARSNIGCDQMIRRRRHRL